MAGSPPRGSGLPGASVRLDGTVAPGPRCVSPPSDGGPCSVTGEALAEPEHPPLAIWGTAPLLAWLSSEARIVYDVA